MRLAYGEEQHLFGETVRDFLAAHCTAEHVRAAWAADTAVSARWAELAKLGVTGLVVPDDHDGLGLGEEELSAVLEQAGYAALPDPLVEAAVASGILAEFAPDAGWLARIARGESVASVLLPGQAFAVEARAADLVVVGIAPADAPAEIHVVDPADCTLTAQVSVDRARKLFRVGFDPVPETLVASGPAAATALARAADRGALGTAAFLLGLTRRMLDMTVAYAKQRVQRGVVIGTHQSVQHHLANVLVKLEFARPVVMRAAYSLARGLPSAPRDVSMAKIYAGEAADLAARNALQVHGAIGYTEEHDLHLFMKRAWALTAAWGDASRHRARVAADLLGDAPAPMTPEL
ncbi:acyl-CoA/acyl-ACP dehydrogenase [Yinghuangia sp. ASG 101]|uniref:acyl-CoA dehydrogenase family protein n=1 Tax=Yinghuangia sp. ASG 101 TaxID=2896848 RepID=UPI001E616EB2|nr:acyl-CoA dehydrogenase family protein [Yinghuangia sp. ASG 101]UGQ09285.1 acyl-CoA/acyl-ACP dehydrogenase [Yinghuangia sp. ASG 101]